MKRLLIATAAMALIGAGSAMAQVTPPATPSMPATTSATPPADSATPQLASPSTPTAAASQPATTPDPVASQAATPSPSPAPATETASAAATPQSASAQGASAQGATATGPVVGDLAQANPPPAQYKPCTSRKQDRCIVMAQAKHPAASSRSGA